jgi:hypothetical protein
MERHRQIKLGPGHVASFLRPQLNLLLIYSIQVYTLVHPPFLISVSLYAN